MDLKPVPFPVRTMIKDVPQLAPIVANLSRLPSALYVTTASELPGLFLPTECNVPVLFLASARFRLLEDGGPDLSTPHVSFDGTRRGIDSSAFLTWQGVNLSIAIDTSDVWELLTGARAAEYMYIIWMADGQMTLSTHPMSEEFLDHLENANQSRSVPRFVPDSHYIHSKTLRFGPLLSPDEIRFLGSNGEPVYVAVDTAETETELDISYS